jgi:two-component system cell cycle sensor histidine kinase/response regulator CckA
MTWKQTRGMSPVEGGRERVKKSSHLPPSTDSAVLSSIVALAPLSVIGYDDDGHVVLWNGEAERLLGWRSSEVLGEAPPFEVSEQSADDARREIARETRDGGIAHMAITVRRILLDDGGTLVVELGTDLDDRRRLERQIVQGVKLESVARLAGAIAHDFNNILAVINCSSELIGDSLAPDDVRHDDVRAIAEASSRAAGLTRQMLAFTRQQVLMPQTLNLNTVVRATERLLLGVAGDDLTLALDLADYTINVRADAAQLEHALIHLVENACEATPKGGRITITTGRSQLDRDPTGGVVPITPGMYGWVTVLDTGRGISRELHGRLFEPFYTTKERGTGTGLGLSAVYGIVKQSGGYTFVQSEPRAGAAFTIYLPIVESPVETRQGIRAERTTSDSPATILLVEDETALRGLMRRILERSGYHVLEAEHGAQALERCQSHEGAIDLIVSDIVMPTMGGREMADRLQAVRPNSRLLFVSGFTDDEMIHREIILAGSAFLQKPFSPTSLVAKIGEMLREPLAEAPEAP